MNVLEAIEEMKNNNFVKVIFSNTVFYCYIEKDKIRDFNLFCLNMSSLAFSLRSLPKRLTDLNWVEAHHLPTDIFRDAVQFHVIEKEQILIEVQAAWYREQEIKNSTKSPLFV